MVYLQVREREGQFTHMALDASVLASLEMLGDDSSFNDSTQVRVGAQRGSFNTST